MSNYDYDLFVIGAGSGGVRAARIAASHGAKVGIAEEYRVGGTCVIRGCVPKKLLVYGAHFAEDLEDCARFGWEVEGKSFDWGKLRDNVAHEVDRLEGLYRNTLGSNDVTIHDCRASLGGGHEVTLSDGSSVTAKYILIAVGARPHVPEIEGCQEHAIVSNDVFKLDTLPKRIAIAGGGYIANEFAGIFNEFGSTVTIVNRGDRILRGYDHQVRDRLLQISMTKGIRFIFNSTFDKVEKQGDGSLRLTMNGCEDMEVDALLFATGRVPNVEGLGLEEAGVTMGERGAICVDDHSRTSVDHIYAVGDVTDRIQLTPVAIREGHAVADNLFDGQDRTVDYANIPSAVFSHPPIAAVGLTESEAREQLGGAYKTYTSDFRAMKNVLAGRNERSLYKLVVDANTDVVVGIHMIGPEAPEVMQAAAIAVKAGLTKQAFDDTIALHPTMAEELVLMR
ncbi:glutathione-disulfide reductase [Sphingomicrobium astaxanthinifaciens]|uniref:glutathione-disulfide reductase n=1 Tax=Sphingomicrobium astaxanthinifaciens TaxID=1227949 RepID=UPI001FCADF5B|nr:glutathione-disulfide reductase [Sphingomicrobium astaxanthinifaciens]MCJ7421985.1 glutathione-disulfide reductase [Sphingomicrobium astaxanthinifaciens]